MKTLTYINNRPVITEVNMKNITSEDLSLLARNIALESRKIMEDSDGLPAIPLAVEMAKASSLAIVAKAILEIIE